MLIVVVSWNICLVLCSSFFCYAFGFDKYGYFETVWYAFIYRFSSKKNFPEFHRNDEVDGWFNGCESQQWKKKKSVQEKHKIKNFLSHSIVMDIQSKWIYCLLLMQIYYARKAWFAGLLSVTKVSGLNFISSFSNLMTFEFYQNNHTITNYLPAVSCAWIVLMDFFSLNFYTFLRSTRVWSNFGMWKVMYDRIL